MAGLKEGINRPSPLSTTLGHSGSVRVKFYLYVLFYCNYLYPLLFYVLRCLYPSVAFVDFV